MFFLPKKSWMERITAIRFLPFLSSLPFPSSSHLPPDSGLPITNSLLNTYLNFEWESTDSL
jgi:hypothetical protein